MSRFIQGDDRNQATLFPESLDDYVAEDSAVRRPEANGSLLQKVDKFAHFRRSRRVEIFSKCRRESLLPEIPPPLRPRLMKLHSDMRAPRAPGFFIHHALGVLRIHHLEMREKAEHSCEKNVFCASFKSAKSGCSDLSPAAKDPGSTRIEPRNDI